MGGMARRYEVIVVGAGPAGSAAAALFAEQGRRVLVLDKARFPRPKPCAEYISPGGVNILDRLGALERIERTGQRRWLRGMQVRSPSGACHLVQYLDTQNRQRRGLSVSRRHFAAWADLARTATKRPAASRCTVRTVARAPCFGEACENSSDSAGLGILLSCVAWRRASASCE